MSPDIEPIVTDLNKILGTAEVELSKQTKIRKEELAAKFDKVHESLQTHEGEQALYSALGNLKGELTKLGIEPPMARGFTTENYLKMFNDIRVSERLDDGEKVSLLKAFQKLTKEGEIPRPFEIALFERQFGSEFAKTLAKLRPLGERRWRQFLDVITLPKATAASLDISRSLRQDALIAIGSPKVFGKSLAAQYKLFRSEKFAQQIEKDIKTDEYAQLRKRAGVTYRERGETAGYEQRQEQFATKYAQRIPGISHSERAFVVGGNYTRALFFNKWANHWQKNGFAATMADYKNLAHITNILTGEGDVKWLGKHADFANALFFSPRFFSSRIQALTTLLDPKLGWATRKILAYHLTSFVATGLGVLGLMSLVPGCDVEKDPRSADFGKIRVGNTRIDFWAGYTPIARFVWQLMTEERKTRAGKVVQQERFDTIVRFLQSKLSPAAGFALDVGRGETFFGQKIEMKADSLIWQFLHRMVPFVIQDVTDAVLYQGLKSGMIVAPLAFHGIGAQTYPISRGAEIQIKKDEIATEVLGKKWDDLGDDVQKLLRDEFPIVEDLERKARNERENTDFIAKIANEQKEVGDRIYKNLPQDVRIELKDLDLNIGGLSRRIGTQWFLNDKRYQEYQNQTFVILNGTLPSMIRSKNWDTLAVEEKRILLEYIITQAKQYARDNVKEKANIQDLEHLEKYFRSRKE